MIDITKMAIKGTTQDSLPIADVSDDLAILKDGSAVLIIRVMAVNFGLLSEQEQEAIIYAYAGLLNSLNFAIQIVIRSQQKDITSYVEQLDEAADQQKNPLLKEQIQKYRQFIVQTVKQNNVLDKKFYIAIPFSYLELGIAKSTGGILSRKKKGLPFPIQTITERAKISLLPKRDHILRQLGRLGLRAKQMTNPELIELFYDIYNHGKEVPTDPNAKAGVVSPSFEGIPTKQ